MKNIKYITMVSISFLTGICVYFFLKNIHTPSQEIVSSISERCTERPEFRVAFQEQRANQGFFTSNGVYYFRSSAAISSNLCKSGTLQLVASGQTAVGQGPIIQITQSGRLIFHKEIKFRQSLKVPIQAGDISIAFLNDYYDSDVRIANFQSFKMLASQCKDITINVPPETGGSFNQIYNSASLVFSVPMKLEPCGAGRISFLASSQSGGGKYSKVGIISSGKSIIYSLDKESKLISLATNGSDIQIKTINPYFKEIADRNLIIESVTYTPN